MTDVVSIAGLTITSQAFGSVNSQSDEFGKQPNDGLIGMAFGTIAQSRQPTFFENLIKERKIAFPLFSVHLSRHEEKGSSVRILRSAVQYGYQLSFILIGVSWLCQLRLDNGPCEVAPRGIEGTQGLFSLCDVGILSKRPSLSHQTYWAINMDSLWVDGVSTPTKLTAVRLSAPAVRAKVRLIPSRPFSQAIDTGTSLIYLPQAVASAFYSLIPGSKRASQYGPGKPPSRVVVTKC